MLRPTCERQLRAICCCWRLGCASLSYSREPTSRRLRSPASCYIATLTR